MARFESPIGNRKISGNKLREFDVPDGEDDSMPQFNVDQAIASGQLKQMNIEEIKQFQNRLDGVSFEEEEAYRPQGQQQARVPRGQQELKEIDYARQERDDRKRGIERLSQGAKKRIDILIGLTRTIKDIDIDGTIYTLQTLKSQERRAALIACSKYDHTVEFPFEVRAQFLTRSLTKIGGLDVEQFLADNSFEITLEFIEELDEHLLARLWIEYNILEKEATNKYAIKTMEDAQEVVADLKK
jgi:hypothetical protein